MPDGFSSLLLRTHHLKVLMKFSSHLKIKSSCLKSFKGTWSGGNILPAMKKSFDYRIKPDRVVKFRVLVKVAIPCGVKRAEGLSATN